MYSEITEKLNADKQINPKFQEPKMFEQRNNHETVKPEELKDDQSEEEVSRLPTNSSLKSKSKEKGIHKLKVLGEIGSGSFGVVFRVEDVKTQELSALKVIVKNDFRPLELEILKMLKKLEGNNYHCIQLMKSFETEHQRYLQFPLYGPTLQTILKEGGYKGLHVSQIKEIMKQICIGVKFLHDNKILHADLKQDNVIFVTSALAIANEYDPDTQRMLLKLKDTRIVLIDFGQAIMMNSEKEFTQIVCCPIYRPPESHLGMAISYPVDVWCVGLICFAMYRGYSLLKRGSTIEILAQLENIFGLFPKRLRKAHGARKYFTDFSTIRPTKFNFGTLQDAKEFEEHKKKSRGNNYDLFKLMEQLLQLDPLLRPTMDQVVQSEGW